jgi:hypothetical protein
MIGGVIAGVMRGTGGIGTTTKNSQHGKTTARLDLAKAGTIYRAPTKKKTHRRHRRLSSNSRPY